ncbi:hypothetical protein OAO01_08060, partial [Oligoflexia bacterium]|nr:hypothetical protein [Oligoflexia bacterium]
GAYQCYQQFENADKAGKATLAAQQLRCVNRFTELATNASTLALSKSQIARNKKRAIRNKIRMLQRSIRYLKGRMREASNKLNWFVVAKYQEKILGKEQKVKELKAKLQGGACTDAQNVFNVKFENNSRFPVEVNIIGQGSSGGAHWEPLKTIPAATIGTVKVSLEKLNSYGAVAGNGEALLGLRVRINNQDSLLGVSLMIHELPSKKPCVKKLGVTLYDDSFDVPKPKLNYGIYVQEDEHTCCNIGTDENPKYPYEYFAGQEGGWPDDAIPVQKGFASMDELVAWLCDGKRKVYSHYWAGNQLDVNGFTLTKTPCKVNQ